MAGDRGLRIPALTAAALQHLPAHIARRACGDECFSPRCDAGGKLGPRAALRQVFKKKKLQKFNY